MPCLLQCFPIIRTYLFSVLSLFSLVVIPFQISCRTESFCLCQDLYFFAAVNRMIFSSNFFFHPFLLYAARACCVTKFRYLFLTYGTNCKCETLSNHFYMYVTCLEQPTVPFFSSWGLFVSVVMLIFPWSWCENSLWIGNKEFMVQKEKWTNGRKGKRAREREQRVCVMADARDWVW